MSHDQSYHHQLTADVIGLNLDHCGTRVSRRGMPNNLSHMRLGNTLLVQPRTVRMRPNVGSHTGSSFDIIVA